MKSNENANSLRLQKFLADQGICSRRQAEVLIQETRVTVNGELATIGQKINPHQDVVKFDGKRIQNKELSSIVLLLHKPKGLLCSNDDPFHDQTVFDLLPPHWQKERLFCAGRLDRDSEGMLILTNDGELSNRLTHPTHDIIKKYHVRIHRDFEEKDVNKLLQGVVHDGEFLKAEKVIPATMGEDRKRLLEIHLNHGKKREIRRLLEALGYFVKKLKRIQIGSLVMKGLPAGAVRKLDNKDIRLLLKNESPRKAPAAKTSRSPQRKR